MKRFFDRYHLQVFSVLTMVTVLYCVLRNHTIRQHYISPKQVIDTALHKNNEVIEKKVNIPIKILEGKVLNPYNLYEQHNNFPFTTTKTYQSNLTEMNMA